MIRFAFLMILASINIPRSMGQEIDFFDTKFKEALIEDGVDDGDGIITMVEAKAITSLDVSSEGIKDMREIQYFTNLQTLYCRRNNLSTLDVSNLEKLNTLDCSLNRLDTLKLSGLSNLHELNCADNNLTTLDVSGLSSLITLDCSDNELSSLDVSSLKNLLTLNCSVNNISSLNVSDLTNLNRLDCNSNDLSALNVSELDNLNTLICSNNLLSSLNISNTGSINDLYAISNPKLRCITYAEFDDIPTISNLDESPPPEFSKVPCVPPIASCKNFTVVLDGAGKAAIKIDDIENGSYDPDEGGPVKLLSVYPNEFDCVNASLPQVVTLTVEDEGGNKSTCEAQVTVVDDSQPRVRARNITGFLDKNGQWSISQMDIDMGSYDNCNIGELRLEGLTNYDCGDVGIHQVVLEARDHSGNITREVARVTVKNYVPDFENIHGVSDGDTVKSSSCQSPWSISGHDLINFDEMRKYGNIQVHLYREELPDDAPEDLYALWKYVYIFKDGCWHTYKHTFYLAQYDIGAPTYQNFPGDTTVSCPDEVPPVHEKVRIIDFCQYVIWDTVFTLPVTDSLSGDTIGFRRRWKARDPSGNESYKDQMVWVRTDSCIEESSVRVGMETTLKVNKVVNHSYFDEKSWTVYPNPAMGYLRIGIQTNDRLQYRIFNLWGQNVKYGQFSQTDVIDIHTLEAGVYLIQVSKDRNILGTQKLMVMK